MARQTKAQKAETLALIAQAAEADKAAAELRELEENEEEENEEVIDAADDDCETSEELDEDAEPGKPTMSETLRKYRVGYQKAVSYSKGATLDNGDALATALRGCTPAQACELADTVLGEEVGHHAARYANLNVGQQRMNSGNRIRAAVKKGTIDTESVLDALKAIKGE